MIEIHADVITSLLSSVQAVNNNASSTCRQHLWMERQNLTLAVDLVVLTECSWLWFRNLWHGAGDTERTLDVVGPFWPPTRFKFMNNLDWLPNVTELRLLVRELYCANPRLRLRVYVDTLGNMFVLFRLKSSAERPFYSGDKKALRKRKWYELTAWRDSKRRANLKGAIW